METIERAPADHHRCPRCGDLVEYKGRGRRPVWCSADCRTQASLERKGNRLAGVQPRVVTVVDHVPASNGGESTPPPPLMSDEELVERICASEALPAKVQDRLRRQSTAGRSPSLAAAGQAAAGEETRDGAAPHGRRTAADWAVVLGDLRTALVRGQVYDRELRDLAAALTPVLDAHERRVRRA